MLGTTAFSESAFAEQKTTTQGQPMAITQQATKLRPNEQYGGGGSGGIATSYYKYEFDAPWDQVQHLVGSKVASGTPGTFKVQFAVTDDIGIDTMAKAWLPRRNGVTYNDKSEFGWKDATFGGAATKQIGLAPSQGNNSAIHMSTDVMNLPSIPRADGKPGGILLVKVTQIDPTALYTFSNGNNNSWEGARGTKPWFREYRSTRVNYDSIADLTRTPSDSYNGGYEFAGLSIVTNNASAVPAELVMFTGDSRQCAAFMTFNFAAPVRMAAMSLGTSARPISTVNAAGSGHSQAQYLALAMDLLNAGLRPTIIYIPGFSPNGFANFNSFKTANDNFMAAARAIPGLSNVKFIIDTDYWVGGYIVGNAAETGRQQCVAYAKSLHNGSTVFCFDSDAIVTDYTNTQPAFKPAYFSGTNFIGGDGIRLGPIGLDALSTGDGTNTGLQAVMRTALEAAPADTTAPVMTGAITISAQTSSGFTMAWAAATDNTSVATYEADNGSGTYVDIGNVLTLVVSGKAASTSYPVRVRAKDAAGNYATPLTATATTTAAPDTTAPVMTGSITVSGQTSSGFNLAWSAATDAGGIAAYEVDNGSGTYVSVGTALTLAVTGKVAATGHAVRVRAKDNAGNYSTPLTATATTLAAPDTTAPVMTGSITVSNITTSGATISCPAATDGVGVTGYEYSINGGTSYTLIPNAGRSAVITGRPEGTEHQVRMRAMDAAGNRSTPLSTTFTTAVTPVITPPSNAVVASAVAESRKVSFPGGTRVIPFGRASGPATPNAPYVEGGKWWSAKHPLDERYWVADITIDLLERSTTATSVEALVAGVTIIQQPVIQGKLIPIKLGGFNAALNAVNFCTFRITCANGERFDRTVSFKLQEGVYSVLKDPDDQSFYVADISNDLVDSNTTASAVLAQPVGVNVLVPAVIQGPLILVKLGGMDTLPAGVNYCDLRIDCANGERFYRTIQFTRVDN